MALVAVVKSPARAADAPRTINMTEVLMTRAAGRRRMPQTPILRTRTCAKCPLNRKSSVKNR
jgi:hypothetical protein